MSLSFGQQNVKILNCRSLDGRQIAESEGQDRKAKSPIDNGFEPDSNVTVEREGQSSKYPS
jgi:hypothetical protein